jgi:hypothetical protein
VIGLPLVAAGKLGVNQKVVPMDKDAMAKPFVTLASRKLETLRRPEGAEEF